MIQEKHLQPIWFRSTQRSDFSFVRLAITFCLLRIRGNHNSALGDKS